MFIEVGLDDTYNQHVLGTRIRMESDRLQSIRSTIAQHAFLIALGEFLRDVKGMTPSSDGRKTYRYVVTDEDLDAVAKMLNSGVKGILMPRKPTDKVVFYISARDAERICDGLELAATWDKTEIYYQLKDWLREEETHD